MIRPDKVIWSKTLQEISSGSFWPQIKLARIYSQKLIFVFKKSRGFLFRILWWMNFLISKYIVHALSQLVTLTTSNSFITCLTRSPFISSVWISNIPCYCKNITQWININYPFKISKCLQILKDLLEDRINRPIKQL